MCLRKRYVGGKRLVRQKFPLCSSNCETNTSKMSQFMKCCRSTNVAKIPVSCDPKDDFVTNSGKFSSFKSVKIQSSFNSPSKFPSRSFGKGLPAFRNRVNCKVESHHEKDGAKEKSVISKRSLLLSSTIGFSFFIQEKRVEARDAVADFLAGLSCFPQDEDSSNFH